MKRLLPILMVFGVFLGSAGCAGAAAGVGAGAADGAGAGAAGFGAAGFGAAGFGAAFLATLFASGFAVFAGAGASYGVSILFSRKMASISTFLIL